MAKDAGAIEKDLDFSKLKVMTDLPQISTKDFSKEDVKKIHDLANKIQKEGNYEQIKDKISNILGWGVNNLSHEQYSRKKI